MSDTPTDAQLLTRARAIAVRQREQATRIVTDRTRRALTADGKLRFGSRDAASGAIARDTGGTGHDKGAEPPLGNPDADGAVLISTTGGARSWLGLAAAIAAAIADALAAAVLDDLGDVQLTDLEDGQVLVWSAADNRWRNGTILYPIALEPLVLDGETLIFDGDVLTIGTA
jgi:hypothetical protein